MVSDDTTRLAETLLQLRGARSDDLPAALFGEHGWTALLVLFVADARGLALNVDDIAVRSRVAPDVCRRWLRYLLEQKLISGGVEEEGSGSIVLSPTGLSAIEGWLAELKRLFEARWGARFDDATVVPR